MSSSTGTPSLATDGSRGSSQKNEKSSASSVASQSQSPSRSGQGSRRSEHDVSSNIDSSPSQPSSATNEKGHTSDQSSMHSRSSNAPNPNKTSSRSGSSSGSGTDSQTSCSCASSSSETSGHASVRGFRSILWKILAHSWLNVLLVFVPAGIVTAQISSVPSAIVFTMNCIAVIPLAGMLAHATESVASELGDALGALMNVTVGNAVELIIFIALTKDHIRIVQASILGSILANLLLILGMAFFLGGMRYREQIYNSTVTQMSACLLSLSVVSLVLPTAFHASFADWHLADAQSLKISRGTSAILLLVYMIFILFQLKTHAYMYESTPRHIVDAEATPGPAVAWLDSSSEEECSGSDTETSESRRPRKNVRKKVKIALRKKVGKKHGDASLQGSASRSGSSQSLSSTYAGSQSQQDDSSGASSSGSGTLSRLSSGETQVERQRRDGHYPNQRQLQKDEDRSQDEKLEAGWSSPGDEQGLGQIRSASDKRFPGPTQVVRSGPIPPGDTRRVRPPGAMLPSQISLVSLNDSHERSSSEGTGWDEEYLPRVPAIILLVVSTALVAVCAEFLVSSIEEVTKTSFVGETFIGLIILPIVGNAAEHITSITVAMKNKMDLAIGVAIGSSIQIAIFITPLIVLLGWILDKNMTLYFTLFETVCLFLSAFIVNFLVLDGRSNYMEGALLCAVYVIISVVAFFYPETEEASLVGIGENTPP